MSRCVVDTNTLIYYLNQVGGEDFRHRFDQWVRDGAVISVVTRIEVLSRSWFAILQGHQKRIAITVRQINRLPFGHQLLFSPMFSV